MSTPVYSTPEWYKNVKSQDVTSDLDRLTTFHNGFKQADAGTLIFAPLDFSTTPRTILDVGTADGGPGSRGAARQWAGTVMPWASRWATARASTSCSRPRRRVRCSRALST